MDGITAKLFKDTTMRLLPAQGGLDREEALALKAMNEVPDFDDPLLVRLRAMERVERVDVGGGRVCWRRFGDAGPPLVLLHGGHGSWLHWARNAEDLATRYKVWVPDLPGYGDSDEPPGTSMEALVDATLRSLDTLVPREQPLRLVGFSFGSLVAAHLADRRGGVSHLGLLGPAGHGGPRRPRGELHAWRGLEAHTAKWNAEMRHNLLMHMLHDPAQADDLALRIHGSACLRTRFHSKTISRAGGLPTLLERHRGQLLVAWGAHDVTLDPGFLMSSMRGRLGQAQLREVADAGHWVQFEAAQAVNELLLWWLDGNDVERESGV